MRLLDVVRPRSCVCHSLYADGKAFCLRGSLSDQVCAAAVRLQQVISLLPLHIPCKPASHTHKIPFIIAGLRQGSAHWEMPWWALRTAKTQSIICIDSSHKCNAVVFHEFLLGQMFLECFDYTFCSALSKLPARRKINSVGIGKQKKEEKGRTTDKHCNPSLLRTDDSEKTEMAGEREKYYSNLFTVTSLTLYSCFQKVTDIWVISLFSMNGRSFMIIFFPSVLISHPSCNKGKTVCGAEPGVLAMILYCCFCLMESSWPSHELVSTPPNSCLQ